MGTVKGKPGYNLDAPELIGQCLRCTKPECDNCLARSAGADARRAFDRWEELIELYNAGVIYRDIGERFGISKEKAGRLCALAVRMGLVRDRGYHVQRAQKRRARYRVRDRATGEILAEGTREECSRRLGFKGKKSFCALVTRSNQGIGARLVERMEP